MKIKIAAGLGLLLLMSACASDAPAPPPPPVAHRPPPPPSTPADQCGAAEAQRYVGRPRSEIPIPVLPALQRVACTTCPVTMDYSARRLNFFYDAQTGRVKEVKCG
ncbi:peptidase inhibitor I78 [Phenylobacterium sp.]|uniref:peptidase inhibitor I78 n=1 Tax=Phenylobacterium sp. TaxID=1871053 RepID=UPI00271848F4|nr:peptidase inhibitor I78 [Phenylobacterium sp.]MDO8801259.1 peptidase inhibitor I78 [Phenylobacterium sp.]